ncbi:ferritin-like domain-containing protein [Moorena sp. SIO4G3]|uniref:ferritin-like domain-containing protein n=1 Tax=Moorena sp. SIO4G3 TaxID=2607821 RepID=UPI00142AF292|nr:ferritin-like domain-containing protein [Moorena sp. SIO4G3]NEO77208.1 hypothetical protein [Moorena sp. SIO4G3]
MSQNHPPQDPQEWKIFPRNLTARAAYIVPGNPTTTRPEDGVDNCYPGLEMDNRNLQKYFFPGTYFEVYRSDGARLAALTPQDQAQQWLKIGLLEEDLDKNHLYLWTLKGQTAAEKSDDPPSDNPPSIDFVNVSDKSKGQLGGLYPWRKVNALFPGKVGIIIGPNPPEEGDELEAAKQKLEELWPSTNTGGYVERPETDLKWAVLIANRAPYLNAQGTLDPDVYQPGELTRTLCTPWTYDFRDCQCFYWASNKPDVNASEDGSYPYLNFQRKNWQVEPQTEDIANSYNGRRLREIDYAEMMTDWEQLRPVVNGRECGQSYKPATPPSGNPLTLEQIKEELAYLATVEHALAVQYLYAYYSVNAPQEEPEDTSLEDFRLWKGAHEIFEIAIDEMRHFRWANEVLKLLGADTTIQRAPKLGRRFQIPFYLQSLTSSQLQWFVDVERPSRSTVVGLDGMYVGIQTSLQNLPSDTLDPETQLRAVEIIKLIIDEGEGHYVRFSTAQQNLAFFSDNDRGDLPGYIRLGQWQQPSDNPDNPIIPGGKLYGEPHQETSGEGPELQYQSNVLYLSLLGLLKIAFACQNENVSSKGLRRAIALMILMNYFNFELARKGMTPLFTFPEWLKGDPRVTSSAAAKTLLNKLKQELVNAGIIKETTLPAISEGINLLSVESGTKQEPVLKRTLKKGHEDKVEDVIKYFEDVVCEAEF